MSRTFVSGDWHGQLTKSFRNWTKGNDCTKDDVLVQLGDFGFLWSNPRTKDENYWLEYLASRDFTLAVVTGNHENYNIINSLPIEYVEQFQGDCRVLKLESGNIYFLLRGGYYIINGKRVVAVGGALSIDKIHRTIDSSWWADEYLSKEEETYCLDNIAAKGGGFDYLLSHTCPINYVREFVDDVYSDKFDDSVSKFLQYIDDMYEFKENHFGHFHTDRLLENHGVKYQCHYFNTPHELI